MATFAQPHSIADEINQQLEYSAKPRVDEFTLNRYRYEMEKLQKERPLDIKCYTAYAKVLYNLGEYEQFLEILEDGIKRYHHIRLLTELTVGRIIMKVHDLYPVEIDIMSDWFNHEVNDAHSSLEYLYSTTEVAFGGYSITLRKRITAKLAITYDQNVHLSIGPIDVTYGFTELMKIDFNFMPFILDELVKRVTDGIASNEEKLFLYDIVTEEDIEKIRMKLEIGEVTEIPKMPGALLNPLRIEITNEEGFWYIACRELAIYEAGESRDVAFEEFFDFLREDISIWRTSSEAEMTTDARELKERYAKYIKLN